MRGGGSEGRRFSPVSFPQACPQGAGDLIEANRSPVVHPLNRFQAGLFLDRLDGSPLDIECTEDEPTDPSETADRFLHDPAHITLLQKIERTPVRIGDPIDQGFDRYRGVPLFRADQVSAPVTRDGNGETDQVAFETALLPYIGESGNESLLDHVVQVGMLFPQKTNGRNANGALKFPVEKDLGRFTAGRAQSYLLGDLFFFATRVFR